MAKKQTQTEFKREKKERIPVWMYPSTLAMMDGAIQQANCKSRSEFLEDAAKYYAGYVSAENAIQYLPPMLVSAFQGTVQNSENHISRLLFKLAVEMDITWLRICKESENRQHRPDSPKKSTRCCLLLSPYGSAVGRKFFPPAQIHPKVQKHPENHIFSGCFGAGGVTRTPDLLITNQLLYRLSYTSVRRDKPLYNSSRIPQISPPVKHRFHLSRNFCRRPKFFLFFSLYTGARKW